MVDPYPRIQRPPCPECRSLRTIQTAATKITETLYCPACRHTWDVAFWAPDVQPSPPRRLRPRERLFEFVRAADRAPMFCDVCFDGQSYGWEVQIFERGALLVSRGGFVSRDLAVQAAEEERTAMERAHVSTPHTTMTCPNCQAALNHVTTMTLKVDGRQTSVEHVGRCSTCGRHYFRTQGRETYQVVPREPICAACSSSTNYQETDAARGLVFACPHHPLERFVWRPDKGQTWRHV